jgi:calmodulin
LSGDKLVSFFERFGLQLGISLSELGWPQKALSFESTFAVMELAEKEAEDRKTGGRKKRNRRNMSLLSVNRIEGKEDFQAAFKMFDTDGNGKICAEELKGVMSTLGLTPTDNELKSILAAADTDGDGEIDFEEFVNMMKGQMNLDGERRGSNISFQSTEDNEVYISVAELKHVMLALGEKLTDEELTEMIQEADINGDGRLNYKEFVAMILSSSAGKI